MNNQPTYNQPPMGQTMPPLMGAPRPRGWRERWMSRFGMGSQLPRAKERTIPNWLIGKSIVFFFVSMFACWAAFGYVPEFGLWIVAVISVVFFFYGSSAIAKGWKHKNAKIFIRGVFFAGLIARLVWMLCCYFYINPEYYGSPIGDRADVEWYMPFAKDLTLWLSGDSEYPLSEVIKRNLSAIDDVGYPMWLGLVYLIVGEENDIFIPLLIKCIIGAYCVLCIYHIAKRHYGEGTARIAAIFVAVNPNMIYWCGTMFKEVEMVFLTCLAIDNFDRVLNSGQKYTFKNLLPGMLATFALFFFRSALAIIIFVAVFAHILMASRRVMSLGKKILAGVLVAAVLVVAMGDRIESQARNLAELAQSDNQQTNMEWRGTREGGNSFAKYAGAAVFTPLIFTIPFPTFNQANQYQILQVQLSGGSYIKNIFSFFVIIVMLMMLISGEWRRHVFILAYTAGYHMVLVMSNFAQSGRFHMPVWPMVLLFTAYGIQVAKTNGRVKRWFPIALVIEVVACLIWNWFKLKGRGMI